MNLFIKAPINTAQPARNQSSVNRGLRGWPRIREAESVISAKSVVNGPRQSAFNLFVLLVVIAVIAILAGLLLPAFTVAARSQRRARRKFNPPFYFPDWSARSRGMRSSVAQPQRGQRSLASVSSWRAS